MEEARSQLAVWQTFFFLIGSSAAALTGLQFVVIARPVPFVDLSHVLLVAISVASGFASWSRTLGSRSPLTD